MRVIENHCCNCAAPGYPCLGALCPRRNVEVLYCNKCGRELGEIFDGKGEELCEECSNEAV